MSAEPPQDVMAAFASSADLLMICDERGAVIAANRKLGDGPIGSLVDPKTRGAFDAAFAAGGRAEVMINGAWYALTISLAGPSGTNRAIVATDITARKRAEALMIDVQGVAHLGTWEWDPTQPHATWSDGLYQIYGLTPETYTPSYEAYLTKVHPDDRAHVMAATEQVFSKHEPYSHDERIVRPDGTIRYLHTWAHAIVDDAGKLVRLIGVCQDITDRKLVELELERAQRLEALGRMTGGIAHDFNNILGVVIGYTSILHRRAAASSPEREQLGEIMNAVERAGKLTAQLLAASREAPIERSPVALDRTIFDLLPLVQRLVGEHVIVDLDLKGGHSLFGNTTQMEQVIMNLAINARDAMPNGGTLRIATVAGPNPTLVVADTGMGMTDDVKAKIFDPFFTTKPVGRGTGLGLATVATIVKQAGGSIDVKSAPGDGTRFTIVFPTV